MAKAEPVIKKEDISSSQEDDVTNQVVVISSSHEDIGDAPIKQECVEDNISISAAQEQHSRSHSDILRNAHRLLMEINQGKRKLLLVSTSLLNKTDSKAELVKLLNKHHIEDKKELDNKFNRVITSFQNKLILMMSTRQKLREIEFNIEDERMEQDKNFSHVHSKTIALQIRKSYIEKFESLYIIRHQHTFYKFTNIVVKCPVATNDAFILSNSNIQLIIEDMNGWLLGDSGYLLKKWLMMTSFFNPHSQKKIRYHKAHYGPAPPNFCMFYLQKGAIMSEDNVEVPPFIIGDPTYPLLTWQMKAYPGSNLSQEQKVFNYRLSTARMTVEYAFGRLKVCRGLLKPVALYITFVKCTDTFFNENWLEDINDNVNVSANRNDDNANGDAKQIRKAITNWLNDN
ncbi:unnamed protein product [Mytilus coruscus]|uniref:DDE Tnp4 domain-containing protein n=1 Tax=Mytilus coruscus TaxID=42192 RepID=A0A6J8DI16_MYTCO|nr:unnamed protein product [Mytilus coruscus]